MLIELNENCPFTYFEDFLSVGSSSNQSVAIDMSKKKIPTYCLLKVFGGRKFTGGSVAQWSELGI